MSDYWERCWKGEDRAELHRYLDAYYGLQSREIELFKEHGAVSVCDAACGFGAYTLAFASNGFNVQGFDISETAVEITQDGLKNSDWRMFCSKRLTSWIQVMRPRASMVWSLMLCWTI
jgi:2-polyprenyl-3-methyl-5-hydroxy-6-metoxy-1,4-benzoquinol methylase